MPLCHDRCYGLKHLKQHFPDRAEDAGRFAVGWHPKLFIDEINLITAESVLIAVLNTWPQHTLTGRQWGAERSSALQVELYLTKPHEVGHVMGSEGTELRIVAAAFGHLRRLGLLPYTEVNAFCVICTP